MGWYFIIFVIFWKKYYGKNFLFYDGKIINNVFFSFNVGKNVSVEKGGYLLESIF